MTESESQTFVRRVAALCKPLGMTYIEEARRLVDPCVPAHNSLDYIARLYPLGTMLQKKRGASWTGKVVGYYSTELTNYGVAVESIYEQGSVQIYPVEAMEFIVE